MTVVTHTYRFSGQGEDFGPRKGNGLVILHTWESAGNTVADAMTGLKWQDDDSVVGSYNRVICVDGVVSAVPDDHISGGVNPASTYFKPREWLYEMLPATKVNDPNSYALQLCAMGQRARYDAEGWPPAIIDGFARSILEEEARVGPVVIANHADFQPGNRTDAGVIAIELVKKRYAELTEDPMSWVSTVKAITPYIATVGAGANTRPSPDFSNTPFTLPSARDLVVVGEVTGEAYAGSTLWKVYQSGGGGFWVYHSSQEIGAKPVSGGFSQAELDAAKATAAAAGFTDAKTKARLAVEAIKP